MQIHELNNFAGTPTSSDYLAIDNSTTTTKIGATGLGVQDQLTVAEAETGTSTASRIVTPKVVHDYVTGEVSDAVDNLTTSATETKWANITGGDGSINNVLDYQADNFNKKITTENLTATTGSSAVSGYYYGDISTDTTDIISAIPYEVTSNRFAIAEIISTTSLRVWSIAASTTVKVRVTRIAQ